MDLSVISAAFSFVVEALDITLKFSSSIDLARRLSRRESLQARQIAKIMEQEAKKHFARPVSDLERSGLKGAVTAAAIVFEQIPYGNYEIVKARYKPDIFLNFIKEHGGRERRQDVDASAEVLYDRLLEIAASEYCKRARNRNDSGSDEFTVLMEAIDKLKKSIEERQNTIEVPNSTIEMLRESIEEYKQIISKQKKTIKELRASNFELRRKLIRYYSTSIIQNNKIGKVHDKTRNIKNILYGKQQYYRDDLQFGER